MNEASYSALRGRVIVVTRPEHQAQNLVTLLQQFGAEALLLPGIVIAAPLDKSGLRQACRDLPSYDFAMFVSSNAVDAVFREIKVWPSGVMALTPGAGTAQALWEKGVPEAQIVQPISSDDSEGLLALPLLQDVSGKRAVIFRGERGREHFSREMQARGASVACVVSYRRVLPPSPSENLRQRLGQAKLDGIVLTAGEAIANFEKILDEATLARLKALPAFVPHPRIGQAATMLSWQHPVITESGDQGLLDGMNAYFSENEGNDNRQ